MTDYLYGISLAQQTKSFLLSLGFGFIMGIFYDLFRIVRICISKGKVATVISDILYCVFLCFCTFIFCLTVNEGEVRFYLLLGAGAGFCVYYFSLGAVVFLVSEKIISFIKKIAKAIFHVISFPFKFIIGKFKQLFNNLSAKSRKNTKNVKNKSKFLLKVNKLLLYNLFVKKQHSVKNGISESEE